MRLVTIVSLGASAVLGLAALFVAKTVLPNAAAAQAPEAAQMTGVPVVIANRDIEYGQKLEAGMLTVARVPQVVAPRDAFTTLEQVLAQDRGGPPVALVPIAAREPLLPAKLSGPGARPTVAAQVADGMRAYTIKVTDVSGVGGHALPGDRVDVVLIRDLTPTGPVRNLVSYVVLQNVRVLGIGLNADLASEKPVSPETATLEVSVEDAQKLSVAATLGELSLALRRTGEAEVEQASPVRIADFLGGPARPAARRVRYARPAPAASRSLILVVEGQGSGGDRRRPERQAPSPGA